MTNAGSQTELSAMNPGQNAAFCQTHWTTVLHSQGSSAAADEALNKLCRTYWPPVHAFIRRRWTQHSVQKAEDLTQGFFAEFVRKLPHLDLSPDKGKFRTYLLACLNRFLCKDWERSPSHHEIPIDPEHLERAAAADSCADSRELSPERAFDVVWANTLTEKALQALCEEYDDGGKSALHRQLLPLLTGRAEDGSYARMAGELKMSEGALRVATHQFRRRFGELLRAQVAQTVARAEDTDGELRYLLSLWAQSRPSTGG